MPEACRFVSQIAPIMPLNGFKNDIVISHLMKKLSINVMDDISTQGDIKMMSTVLSSHDECSTAYMSGLSVAEALFGRLYQVEDMVEHSAYVYGQALRQLRNDLHTHKSTDRTRAYINLWSCLFLGVYEMVCSSNPTNWLKHSRGVSALVSWPDLAVAVA